MKEIISLLNPSLIFTHEYKTSSYTYHYDIHTSESLLVYIAKKMKHVSNFDLRSMKYTFMLKPIM